MKPTFVYTREVYKDGVHIQTTQRELTLDDVLLLRMNRYSGQTLNELFDSTIASWNIQGQRENVNKMKYVYTRVYPE